MTPHGPALIKVGACMGNVVEFYGVFLGGLLQPHRFRTYAEAEKHFLTKLAELAT
jgi:hypothetical protein